VKGTEVLLSVETTGTELTGEWTEGLLYTGGSGTEL
jgi:hypothetical protein